MHSEYYCPKILRLDYFTVLRKFLQKYFEQKWISHLLSQNMPKNIGLFIIISIILKLCVCAARCLRGGHCAPWGRTSAGGRRVIAGTPWGTGSLQHSLLVPVLKQTNIGFLCLKFSEDDHSYLWCLKQLHCTSANLFLMTPQLQTLIESMETFVYVSIQI